MNLEELAWTNRQLPELFEALALTTGLPLRRDPLPDVPDLRRAENRHDPRLLDDLVESWIKGAARARGLDVESTAPTFQNLDEFWLRGGPAIVLLLGAKQRYLLALVGKQGQRVRLLVPGRQQTVLVPVSAINAQLEAEWYSALHRQGSFVESIGLDYTSQESLRRAFLHSFFETEMAAFAWMLQPSLSDPLPSQLRRAHLWGPGLMLGASALASTTLSLIGWYTVGSDALSGRTDRGRLVAWSLVMAMTVPLAAMATHAQGKFGMRLSLLLKRVLLQGCINLSSDQVRTRGLGHQLALVSESAVLDQFAISNSFSLVVGLANLATSAYLFWLNSSSRHLIPLLALWTLLVLGVTTLLYRRRRWWTTQRLSLTDNLVAKMMGHRTRRIQQAPSDWHEGEDELVADYWQASHAMDRLSLVLASLPRSWMFVGAVALLPVLLAPSTGQLLAAMVAMLLSFQSLQMLIQGLMPVLYSRLAVDFLAGPLAAARLLDERPVSFLLPQAQRTTQGPLLEMFDVVFRFRPQGTPVLRGCNLSIFSGQHLLLEGSSGGGKSTLTSLLAGLRSPESGIILVADYDHHTLNREAWRQVVTMAPQFHENHVFSNTLAFNLLLGRRWPPAPQDIEEAKALCEELGLGPLLGRMPNGVQQLVGEMGWQLSHGEKSRVFIARALLQGADLLILDESFGALDPETLELCMATVLRHAKTLLVIAHP